MIYPKARYIYQKFCNDFSLLILSAGLALLSCSCHTIEKEKSSIPEEKENRAEHFELVEYPAFKILSIIDPWQKAGNALFSYCLAERKEYVPDSLSGIPFIRVPVRNYIVFSTTHAGFLKALGIESAITGASGAEYLYDPELRGSFLSGKIAEVGYPPSVNYEKILELQPEMVFLYGIESSVAAISKRLESVGIPSVIIGEYLENNPLGKLEWIRVFGALTGRIEEADSIYFAAVKEYNRLCMLVSKEISYRPVVLLGLPWKDTWYMAGGKSYTARMIMDSGADYIWKTDLSEEFIPLSVEAVMSKGIQSEYWLNPGSARSLSEITGRDRRYEIFLSRKQGRVYNNDRQLNQAGSNNFWEQGTTEPQVVLKDLIKIFHPELMSEHDFVYYRQLE